MSERKNLVERITLDRESLLRAEKEVLVTEHIRRYAAIRRFCYGVTLDAACGCGYGSFLLAANPYVTKVVGVDTDSEGIASAEREYAHPKIQFLTKRIEEISGSFDTLVCLETIEHVADVSVIPALVARCSVNNVIVSFPDKPTKAYNPFHAHDFVFQDIVDLFKGYLPYHSIRFVDSQSLLLMKLPSEAPWELFRNVRDL